MTGPLSSLRPFLPNFSVGTAKIVVFGLVFAVVVAALLVWRNMPIYPDEIALRIQSGRYLQDHGLRVPLWALCSQNDQAVPWIFVAPAWVMSKLDLWLSPAEARVLPWVAAAGCLFFAGAYLCKKTNFWAVTLLAAAIFGVAGSSIVLARHECILLLNIACCLWALGLETMNRQRKGLRWLVAMLLFFTSLLSLYVHPQGLIFLPLSVFMMYRVVFGDGVNKVGGGVCLLILAYLAYAGHAFFSLSCPAFPDIESFWHKQVFNPLAFWNSDTGIVHYTADKFRQYALSFVYKAQYQNNYLPGIAPEIIKASHLLKFLNYLVPVLLLAILLLNIAAAGFLGVMCLICCWTRRKELCGVKFSTAVFCLFLIGPTLALFFGDVEQNFYRSLFLQFLFALGLAIVLGDVRQQFARYAVMLLGGLCVVAALLSVMANHIDFAKAIKTYEGPSMSLSRNWAGVPADVARLAHMCGIEDLSVGGAIVSDYTYDSLKRYGTVYHIDYLGLQKLLTKLSITDILKIVKPRYAIAMCSEMQSNGFGWPAGARLGDICCANFMPDKPHE